MVLQINRVLPQTARHAARANRNTWQMECGADEKVPTIFTAKYEFKFVPRRRVLRLQNRIQILRADVIFCPLLGWVDALSVAQMQRAHRRDRE